ncbi:AAA family ATPase [Geodermatophilus sp. DSM 45219]|uniref:ATP-binding protein n=1 Tax=Geodermatophilus sp. DSM 45219 TaxID=1881103 RepID=UPI000AED3EFD|nr:LuxR family transcriptional regulator [Geodermatophilus sp. DSM 45219]
MTTRDPPRIDVLGRTAERRVLAGVIDTVRSGRSGVLVIRGQAGIGKTTLLDDAVRAVPVQVLRARGVQAESELPFAALHQLLQPIFRHIETLPAHQRRTLRIALGMECGPDGAAPGDRFLVAVAVLGVLDAAAEEAPVVCLVDDAQWLDQASAAALLFVARRLGAEPIGILFAVREPDLREFPPTDLPELRVEGLDAEAADTLLAEHTGIAIDARVRSTLVRWTGGNPLMLDQLPSLLSPDQLAGRSPLPTPLPLPRSVERLFTGQVRALPDGTRTLLLVAAAEDGGRLDRVLAAGRVLGVPDTALEPAERTGLVAVRADEVVFAHPLVRSAAYHAATSVERRRAHLALARAAADTGDVDHRAWHVAAAAQGPDEDVAAELESLAVRAGGRGGLEAATAALERAAELSPDGAARSRRLLSAARSAWLAGQLGHVAALLQVARPLASQPLVLADVDQLRGWLEFSVGDPGAASRILLDAALEVTPSDPRRTRRMLAAVAESAWLESDRPLAVRIREAMTGLPPPDDVPDRWAADLLRGFLAFLEGDVAGAVRALGVALRTAQHTQEEHLLRDAAQHALYLGDDDAALRLSAGEVARARALGAAAELLFSLPRLAHAELLHGNWTAAAADAAEAVRLAEATGQPGLAALPLAWLSLVSSMRGARSGADDPAGRLEALARAHGLGVFRLPALEILRWGRATEKLVAARPGSAYVLLEGLRHPVVTTMAAVDLVEAAVQSGHRDVAQQRLARMETLAAATGAPWALAVAAHGRGVLSEGAVAQEHFEEALHHHGTAGRLFARGRTHLAYGEALRRARHRVAARGHLAAALDVFDALGASQWTERTRLELRACGESAGRRDPSALLELTPQELQVARFVASGLPTRAVAAQLFLSPRTVDFHLRNVFTKLGISSRAQLAAHHLG